MKTKLTSFFVLISLCNSAQTAIENIHEKMIKAKKVKTETVYASEVTDKSEKAEAKKGINYAVLYSSQYDKAGNIVQFTYNNSNDSYKSDNKYDSLGNLVQSIYKGDNDSIIGTTIYKYDPSNKLIEKTKYDKRGNVLSTFDATERKKKKHLSISYGKKGRVKKEEEELKGCTSVIWHRYKYDKKGLVYRENMEQYKGFKSGVFKSWFPCALHVYFAGGIVDQFTNDYITVNYTYNQDDMPASAIISTAQAPRMGMAYGQQSVGKYNNTISAGDGHYHVHYKIEYTFWD